MHSNKNQSKVKIRKNKLNQGQHNRQGQYFKKKYHKFHRHTISNQINYQLKQENMIEMNEMKSILISEEYLFRKKCYPSHIRSNIDPTQLLFDYSIISNKDFQQKLSIVITRNNERNFLIELFNNEETLTSIRQLTQSINKLNYSILQHEQWTYYYNLGIREGIWNGRVSKKMALINSMCSTYGRRKILIEQRQKYFQQQIEENTSEIDEHLKQLSTSIDANRLIEIIIDLVCQDQNQLRLEFQRRRSMLKFDAKDHQLVEAFYQLKPRQTEIHSAKIIWKATDDEQKLRYEIDIFKKWLSDKSSSTCCTFQDLALTKINSILINLLFDKQCLSTIHVTMNKMKSIHTFINDLAIRTISVAEEIAQTYLQKAIDEKTKILNNGKKFKKLPTVDTIITAIENRQTNMVHRAQYNIARILHIIEMK
ncbi:unnamed protein product [Rotaria sordida]|uniref:Uncharacterized protein n=1 Tax=Rotaria sordida TaxID=392033 RepID=A0A815J270_9BILA|nr:unnamed protein product [Rotaria sordida]